MIEDHALLGVCFNQFEANVSHYWAVRKTEDPHNAYLLVGGELGIPGMLALFWILWCMFVYARRLYRKTSDPFSKALALGYLGGFFGLLVSNMYGSRLNYAEVTSYFWILTALMM